MEVRSWLRLPISRCLLRFTCVAYHMSYSLNSLQGGHVGEYYRGYKGIYQEFRVQLIYLFQISPVSMQEPLDHIHTNVPTAGGLEGLCPRVERHRKCQQHLRHAQDVSVNPMKTAPPEGSFTPDKKGTASLSEPL